MSMREMSPGSRGIVKNEARNKRGSKASRNFVSRTLSQQAASATMSEAPAGSSAKVPELADQKTDQADDQEEVATCWICAEPVKYLSISHCNHQTCHVCALRLRALYKKMDCTFCKDPQDKVIFAKSSDRLFADFDLDNMLLRDPKLSIYFEMEEIMEDTLILLRFNCPDPQCPYVASGWEGLKSHARDVHSRRMCEICIRSKKVFAHEHTLYTANQLYHHIPSLLHRSNKPISKDQIEGGVHPLCEFCHECFFGDDELYSHMRERHEECFICKRNDVRDQYFMNYESLEKHFHHSHFPCKVQSCLNQKFVVFGSTMDLQAHMVEEHGSSMSSKDRKDIRRIAADFELEEVGGNRRHRRAPGSDHVSASQMSGPNSARRHRQGFGSNLTSTPSSNLNGSSTDDPSRIVGQISSFDGGAPISTGTQFDVALMTRLSSLSSNSSSAMASIKAALQSYIVSESTARDLISTCYNVLGTDLDKTSSLVTVFVNQLQEEEKKQDILAVWNSFKLEQRKELPTLISDSSGSAYAGIASGRVLHVKHSTAARQSTSHVWDRVARAASTSASSANPQPVDSFPALGLTKAVSGHPATPRQAQHSTPWASSATSRTSSAQSVANGSSSVPVSSNRGKNNAASVLSSSAFPMLPSASGSRVKPTLNGNKSLRNIVGSSTPPTAWSSAGREQETTTTDDDQALNEVTDDTSVARSKKKKGKEKVTLFTIGAFPS